MPASPQLKACFAPSTVDSTLQRPIDIFHAKARKGLWALHPFCGISRGVCVRAREVFLGTRGSRVGQKAPKERKVAELGWKKRSDAAAFCGLLADAQPSPSRRPPLAFSFSLSFPPQLSPLILRLPQVEAGGWGGSVWGAPELMWEEGPPAQSEGPRLQWRMGRPGLWGGPGKSPEIKAGPGWPELGSQGVHGVPETAAIWDCQCRGRGRRGAWPSKKGRCSGYQG